MSQNISANAGTAAKVTMSGNGGSNEGDMESKRSLGEVMGSILKTLSLLHQLHLTVSPYNISSQLTLLQRLNTIVLELDNMKRLADDCNIQVPIEVVYLIDDGKNPDEFTKDVLNLCIARNQMTKGKTDAFKSLQKHLLEELEQTFPDEIESYRDVRALSAAGMLCLVLMITNCMFHKTIRHESSMWQKVLHPKSGSYRRLA
ncbi:Mediator of RNA polymerase II transcription subunit 10b [Acorus gramineus]|uniref:Mediator of RNA polymerase II transcription subunit 10 n=1 Tax=Acorus gramineus TaxID=55184 RepID=A0AAV9A2T5_ACOGR|nr:Mediator of RNA polymerase II transcription subunit 10b [Acorus gramineus]